MRRRLLPLGAARWFAVSLPGRPHPSNVVRIVADDLGRADPGVDGSDLPLEEATPAEALRPAGDLAGIFAGKHGFDVHTGGKHRGAPPKVVLPSLRRR